MKEHLIDLIEHDLFASKLIISHINENEINDDLIDSWVSHIIVAQLLWHDRINNLTHDMHPWDTLYKSEWSKKVVEANTLWRDLIYEFENDYSRRIDYKDSKGVPHYNHFIEIVYQILMHGNYHRGQINRRFRELNYETLALDYIYYKRKPVL